jgi:hypothetical protein
MKIFIISTNFGKNRIDGYEYTNKYNKRKKYKKLIMYFYNNINQSRNIDNSKSNYNYRYR